MTTLPVLSIALALLAAFLFACASVAQQSAAAEVPDGESLIASLIRSPRWWAGAVGDVGGYGVQVAALWVGSVLVVQPLMVSMLLFALPLSAKFSSYRMTRSTWLLALSLAAALGVFIVVDSLSIVIIAACVAVMIFATISLSRSQAQVIDHAEAA